MEAPLLVKAGDERRRGVGAARWAAEIREGGRLVCLAAPISAVTLSQFMVPVISSMMASHLGKVALFGSATATSFTVVTGFGLFLGMASGLDTLCKPAYGAHYYEKLASEAQSATLALILFCIPIAVVWASMGKLYSFMGHDTQISLEAGRYAMWMIPSLFAYALAQPMMKFLQSQNIVLPVLLSSVLTLCLHVPLCWFLVFKSGLGSVGGALSVSISYWLNVFVIGFYIRFSKSCPVLCAPISLEAFRGISKFLRIALCSAVMICLEWWCLEVFILLSGILSIPNPKVEAPVLSICLTTVSCLYAIPYGLGAAASTRVSNELEDWNPEGARLVVRVVMMIAVTEAVIVSTTMFLLRTIVGYAYNNEKEFTDPLMEMVPVVCVSVIMDTLQGVLSGITRGCRGQYGCAIGKLGIFTLCGIELAKNIGSELGGKGLWVGLLVGSALQTTIQALVTRDTDWKEEARKARERLSGEGLLLKLDLSKQENPETCPV